MHTTLDAARPEQIFFPDPAIDRVLGVVMALATEVYVLRDRTRALEAQLAGAGRWIVRRWMQSRMLVRWPPFVRIAMRLWRI